MFKINPILLAVLFDSDISLYNVMQEGYDTLQHKRSVVPPFHCAVGPTATPSGLTAIWHGIQGRDPTQALILPETLTLKRCWLFFQWLCRNLWVVMWSFVPFLCQEPCQILRLFLFKLKRTTYIFLLKPLSISFAWQWPGRLWLFGLNFFLQLLFEETVGGLWSHRWYLRCLPSDLSTLSFP